jgi:hypothetical protein
VGRLMLVTEDTHSVRYDGDDADDRQLRGGQVQLLFKVTRPTDPVSSLDR